MRSMRRHALEVTVQTAFGPLRIVNTHLEYHSAEQREAQIARLLDLQQEASTSPKAAGVQHGEPYGSQTLAASSVLCGDFNFDVTDPQHAMIIRSSRPGLNYRDAWAICHPGQPRAPTCGLHDHAQWPTAPIVAISFSSPRRWPAVFAASKSMARPTPPIISHLDRSG